MSRILVTGAAGFLGSQMCETLLDMGHEVVGIDNYVTGRAENLESCLDHERFSFHEHDITEPIEISGDLDAVFHFASLASPVFYRRYPIETLTVGATGTHETLKLAETKNAKYLFTSTSEIYGDPEVNPQPESYHGNVDPFGPRSCYDESKRYGESLVRAYRNERGLDVRVARIFNTYGPQMRIDDGRVIPNFVRQALEGEDLTVYGDGSQTRSFCYVSDMIRGLLALFESDVQTPVNLGNPDERTINELADVVLDVTGSDSGITYRPLPPKDPKVRKPDIRKARSEVGWEPAVSLVDGLEETVAYFERQL